MLDNVFSAVLLGLFAVAQIATVFAVVRSDHRVAAAATSQSQLTLAAAQSPGKAGTGSRSRELAPGPIPLD
jgi:hypothetical protein